MSLKVPDLETSQLDLLTRRDVDETGPDVAADLGDRLELRRIAEAVRNPDAHHETAGRLSSKKDSCPFQPLSITVGYRFPASS